MLRLNEMLAEKYMTINKGVSVYVRGGGSLVGFKALVNKEADICASSKKINAAEIKDIADRFGSLGVSHLIAKDGFSILINPDNPVEDLSIEQLKGIFTGRITNWSELGGYDAEILPIIRTKNSGSYEFFRNNVLEGEEYAKNCLAVKTTNSVVEAIQDNESSIGYAGIGYAEDVKTVKIDDIAPTEINVVKNRYKLTRYLHFYTANVPTGLVKDFIDWVTGPEGQKTVNQAGYYPLWEIPY
jgi:phosphate transport system substrate-binding protein